MVRTNAPNHSPSRMGDLVGKGMIMCCVVLLLVITVPALLTTDGDSDTGGFATDGGIEWQYSGNVLTIRPASSPQSGYTSGQMKDYDVQGGSHYTTAPWGSISATSTLKVLGGVTSIGDGAFSQCSGFSGALYIPEGVTKIGHWAFYNCYKFTGDLKIPDTVLSIGEEAFYNAQGFNGTITIGKSVTSIGGCAFYHVSKVTGSLTIPDSVTSIGGSAFERCFELNGTLTLGSKLNSVGIDAFYGCCNLAGVISLGDKPDDLGKGAFKLNSRWSTVGVKTYFVVSNGWANSSTFPEYNDDGHYTKWTYNTYQKSGGICWAKDTTLKYLAIAPVKAPETGCEPGEMKDYTFDESAQTSDAPWGRITETGWTLVLEEGITNIGNNAFRMCSGLTGNLTIPSTVKTIGDYAFSSCSGLTGPLSIPDSVVSIGSNAFSNCDYLNGSLWIGKGVTSIGVEAFSNCPRLTDITFVSKPTLGERAFKLNDDTSTKKTYNVLSSWANATLFPAYDKTEWNYTSSVAGGIEWYKDTTGKKLIIKSTEHPEVGCTKGHMKDYDIDQSGETSNAPWGKITETGWTLVLEEGITNIGNNAFYKCSGFTGNLTLPSTATSIGLSAFFECNGFTGSLTIPDSVDSIGNYAFCGCYGFTGSLTIPDSVDSIGEHAFDSCSNFNGTLTLPNGITSIGSSAFRQCTSLTGSLIIPNSVTDIGGYAFSDCYSLTDVKFLGSKPTIGDQAFHLRWKTPAKTYNVFSDGWANAESFPEYDYTKWNYYNPDIDGGIEWYTDTADKILVIYPASSPETGYTSGQMKDYTDAGPWGKITESGWTLEIESGVKNIGNNAFNGSTSLVTALISDSVNDIGDNAFNGCSELTAVYMEPGTAPELGANAFNGCKSTIKFYVPDVDGYKQKWVPKVSAESIVSNLIEVPKANVLTYNATEQTVTIPAAPNLEYVIDGTLTGTDAGTYTATATLNPDSNLKWKDGTKEAKSIDWSIAKAKITVTPDSGKTKVYGESDPTFTYTYSGAQQSETPAFTGALSRVAGENVGIYAITQGDLVLADNGTFKVSNYEIYFVDTVTFEIIPATYIVSFVDENGETVAESKTVVMNHTVDEPTIQLKDDEVITGWYNGNKLWNFDTDVVTSNMTLTVKISIIYYEVVVIEATDYTAVEVELNESISTIIVALSDGIVEIDDLCTNENLLVSVEKMASETEKYDITTLLGEESYKGKITISLPYNVDKTIVQVYYYPESGDKVLMDATFDETTGMVTFTTNHNSVYGIEYSEEPTPVSSSSNGSIALLIVFIIAVLGVTYVGLVNREN